MNPWKGLRGLPRPLWTLALATLINRAGTMALPFLVLYQMRVLHLGAPQAGVALVVYGVSAMAAAPLGGRLSDRLGSVPVMKASLTASGLLMIVLPFVKGWIPLLVLVSAWSLSAELFRPANMAILADLAPPDLRKATFALNRLAINLGMSIGPAVGGFLASRSYPALFMVDGITSLLSAGVLSLWIAAPPPRRHAEGARTSHAAWKDRRFMLYLLASLPVLIVFFQHEGPMPVYLVRDLHFGEAFYGLIFTVNTLLIVSVEVAINLAMAHWSHARIHVVGALLYGLGFGATAYVATKAGLLATVIVWTFAEMILLPGMADFVTHLAPAERRGEYMGLYTLSFGVAFSLGPWLGVLAYGRLGPFALWNLCLGLGVLSAALLGWICREPIKRTAES
ncbi:MAG TPA: MFS transporter [Holophagaceae bacterium]|nr:MFS transporter [Holophagaceae bacterium]